MFIFYRSSLADLVIFIPREIEHLDTLVRRIDVGVVRLAVGRNQVRSTGRLHAELAADEGDARSFGCGPDLFTTLVARRTS